MNQATLTGRPILYILWIGRKLNILIPNSRIYILFIVTVSFATKEYIIYYLAMDFQKVAACCTDTVIIVRGYHTETVLFA